MRKVLVTGAGGFCGSHLVERLLECGHAVRGFVRYNGRGSTGWLDALRDTRLEIVLGDLEDASAVLGAVDGVDDVFHLGALIGIPYSYVHPEEVLRTNVLGTFNVLMGCKRAEVRRLVHLSSSEVYGTARTVPIAEDHPLSAQSPYSASKIAADKLVESFHLSFGIPAVTIRPFNMYGPRQSPRAVIPTIVSQLLAGDRLRLGSLRPTRDFTYVDDTVGALVAASEAARDVVGETMNAGSGAEISVGDLARKIAALMGRDPRLETDEERLRPASSEVQRLLADSSRARRLLGWQPQVTLDEGLERTIAWIRDHAHLHGDTSYRI